MKTTKKFKLDPFFNLSHERMCIVSLDNTMLHVNDSLLSHSGFKREEIENKSLIKFIHVGDMFRVTAEITKTLITGKSVNFQSRILAKDGHYDLISWNVVLSREDKVFYAIGREVTNELKITHKINQLSKVVELTKEAIFIVENGGRVLYQNTSAAALFVLQDLNNLNINNIITELSDYSLEEFVLKRKRKILTIKNPKNIAEALKIKVEVVPIDVKENESTYAVIINDVTKKIKEEEFLKEAQEIANLGGWEINLATQQVVVTDQVYKIYGLKDNENIFLGPNSEFYSKEEFEKISNTIKDCIRLKKDFVTEVKILKDKINEQWIKVQGYPIIENNKVVRLRGVIQNIDHKKRLDLKLRENKNRLQHFIRNTPVNVVVLDNTFAIMEYSEKWKEMMCKDISEVIGKNHFELLKGQIPPKWESIFISCIENGVSYKKEEEYIGCPQNGEVYIKWSLKPWYESKNKIGGLIFYSDSKTNSVNHRKELNNMLRDLERSNTELEQFAYIASHDLQEPLRKVYSFSDLILKKEGQNLTEKGKLYFSKVQQGAEQMHTLIQDLLTYSRVLGDKYEEETISIHKLLKTIKSQLEVTINKSNTTLNFENLPDIKGSKMLINQLFINLINNAIKFSKPNVNPHITISYEENDFTNTIFIQDNGIGIDEKYKELIFKPFKRLHSKDSQYKGNGIGLAICVKIMNEHNGDIDFKSEEGKGTTFELIFPK